MLKEISKFLKEDSMSSSQMLLCIEEVRETGNVFILKVDGERSENHYTVMITFPNSVYETIRCDDAELFAAVRSVLNDYYSVMA